ncbi:hypothetical protein [Pseudomonas amygdali]|uniref:Uncharacterized protein n=1 Tax=Pseudomonas amygdali pv. lachrymans str. M301315 TaxID=629260 RepID=A0AAD0PRA4_PSEAV|nr:hypothetical protein [Pseudomonas amygdali]AXH54539.1 hypothetical protein PLA107_003745 [Pseudomonas amygdali pv. lachrymans str. M301315]PWD01882.1 hypothetical protein CX658_18115 [Pseudomonas amygdali pv. lachrymans]RMT18928.1 hypothetical protein ALP54_04149 [Pseudomonas amygdali pv. lachrymans]
MDEQSEKESGFLRVQIKVKLKISTGNYGAKVNEMRSLPLAGRGPTLHFLDLCAISHIKTYLKKGQDPNAPIRESISELRKLDVAGDGISYLASLLEKTSDLNRSTSDEELVSEVEQDLASLQQFFKNSTVYEGGRVTPAQILDLKGEHPEELGPIYHQFLIFINSLKLSDVPAADKRLEVVAQVSSKAQELGILKNHPLVIVSIACIYGFVPAAKVIKFKDNPAEFNASGALGDIQLIQRLANMANLVREVWRQHRKGYAHTNFFTDDRNLRLLLECFVVRDVSRSELENMMTTSYQMTTDFARLLPVLHNRFGEVKGLKEDKERSEIYRLLGIG